MAASLFASLHRRYGPKDTGISRRDFLKSSVLASAAVLLSSHPLFADDVPRKNGLRVVVVGAGFAGLCCAYEMAAAGYDVQVVEARDRLGGRVVSFSDLVAGKNVEGGGELIGKNHPHWIAYRDKFNLKFIDVSEDPEGTAVPLLLNGKALDAKEAKVLYDQLQDALNHMNEDARAVVEDEAWNTPNSEALDKKTTKQWLDALDVSPLCRAAVISQLQGNNGQAIEKQSYLGNLAQIKGGGVEKYWTDSETYRCDGGNQQLAVQFAKALGERVQTGAPVKEITAAAGRMIVKLASGKTIEADDVVLATPPSTWKNILFTPDLPAKIAPQMGVNIKYMAAVKSRFWKDKKISPDAQTDNFISMTWEGTDAQAGDDGAEITCFSGGPAASDAIAIAKDQRDAKYGELMEKMYAGFGAAFVKSRFMNWPADPMTLAGYSFPAPGEVTTVGPLLARGVGHLHFAGEHACYKFVGYMEGALTSGATVAMRLAKRDGVLKEAAPVKA